MGLFFRESAELASRYAFTQSLRRATTEVVSEPSSRKASRAAVDPDRPGENCRAEPGSYRPVVNHTRCEGKADCVEVCPYGVFEVRRIDEDEFRTLGALARFKLWVHGKRVAYTPRSDACQACGLCVVACPEHAIRLERSC